MNDEVYERDVDKETQREKNERATTGDYAWEKNTRIKGTLEDEQKLKWTIKETQEVYKNGARERDGH